MRLPNDSYKIKTLFLLYVISNVISKIYYLNYVELTITKSLFHQQELLTFRNIQKRLLIKTH